MPPNALPRPGDVVAGKYRIDSVIGEGGMGVVLGATDTSLNRPVAIKFLTPARASNADAAARFDREARAAASIQSEHVVRIYEVGKTPNGAPFIVMEHLRGSDLAGVVQQRGPLPFDFACDVLLQTCEALGDAHQRGIVHRDLKPQNLFLTQRQDGSPSVKVLDFGISKATDEAAPQLTSTDMVMGTPLYMSPEQVRSVKNVDLRADIWALGAILHELLTGGPPFDGPTASALHAAIAMDPPPPLRQKRPDAPAALEAIILRCLEKNPQGRFQNVAELADALRSYASPIGQMAASRVPRSTPQANPIVVASMPPAADPRPRGQSAVIGNASTMNAWAPTMTSPPQPQPPPKRGASRTAWIVGTIAGVVLLSLVTCVAVFFFLYFRDQNQSVTIVTSNAPASSSASGTVPDVAVTNTTPATPSTPALPAPHKPSTPVTPPVAPDAGLSADDARLQSHCAAQKPLCDGDLQQMRATTGDTQKSVAVRSKNLCHTFVDACACERVVCREACGILNDQTCLSRLDNADQTHKAKF